MMTEKRFTLIEIAVRVRSDLNEHFCDKFKFSVNASQDESATGLISITVTQWPEAVNMLSREFIQNDYLAVLQGTRLEMSPAFMLSKEAESVHWDVRSILDGYVGVYTDPRTGLEERSFIGDIAFSASELAKERRRHLDECKRSLRLNSAPSDSATETQQPPKKEGK